MNLKVLSLLAASLVISPVGCGLESTESEEDEEVYESVDEDDGVEQELADDAAPTDAQTAATRHQANIKFGDISP